MDLHGPFTESEYQELTEAGIRVSGCRKCIEEGRERCYYRYSELHQVGHVLLCDEHYDETARLLASTQAKRRAVVRTQLGLLAFFAGYAAGWILLGNDYRAGLSVLNGAALASVLKAVSGWA